MPRRTPEEMRTLADQVRAGSPGRPGDPAAADLWEQTADVVESLHGVTSGISALTSELRRRIKIPQVRVR